MKSNKQRKAEIKARRAKRAQHLAERWHDPRWPPGTDTPGLVLADAVALAHNGIHHNELPRFYLDREFTCRDCGAEETWTAKQQKWWYEVIGARIESNAVRCRTCRAKRRETLQRSRAAPGADRIGEISRRLRQVADAEPNPETRALALQSMESKHWGLRILAINALGRWGSEDDVVRLRALIDERGWPGHAGATVVARALGPHLRHPHDDAWAIETCLAGHIPLWPWRAFLRGLAPQAVNAWSDAEMARNNADRLERWITLTHFARLQLTSAMAGFLAAHPNTRLRSCYADSHCWPQYD